MFIEEYFTIQVLTGGGKIVGQYTFDTESEAERFMAHLVVERPAFEIVMFHNNWHTSKTAPQSSRSIDEMMQNQLRNRESK